MKPAVITLSNLSFSYNTQTPILQGISLEIKEGEFIALFGPNGGGKTTFLKLLLGFLSPQQGKLALFSSTPQEAREKIGYVPQSTHFDALFPISVLDIVLMGCLSKTNWRGALAPEWKDRAHELLKTFGLQDKAQSRFGTLSGGQAQRVLIARALIRQPSLLLLDEPTSNVDAKAEEDLFQFLLSLKGKITIVMITHNLPSVIRHVDRLFCINRQVSSYLPDEVCQHFALGLYHTPLLK